MKRLYEWQFTNGKTESKPMLAANACIAYLLRRRGAGIVRQGEPGHSDDPARRIWLTVVATGERVPIELSECQTKARMWGVDSAQWYGPLTPAAD